jgi:hypothetical protein
MSTAPYPFSVEWHEPSGRHFLYLDAGTDPNDGAPLTLARPASPAEVYLWQRGRYHALARSLGLPPPERPGLWARVWNFLWRR